MHAIVTSTIMSLVDIVAKLPSSAIVAARERRAAAVPKASWLRDRVAPTE